MSHTNIDSSEIKKFDDHAHLWWDPEGPLKTLHDINPLRISYIQSKTSLMGKKALDIGCGGGILAESMSQLGAIVTAIDMSEHALRAAKLHQHVSGTTVEYLLTTAEALASEKTAQYDTITCLELLEHVPDPAAVIKACRQLVKPQGNVFFSTLNRSLKSYLFAIIGAEYLLKILPKDTHDYAKFIRPSELADWACQAGLHLVDLTGMVYHPLTQHYSLSADISVNYLAYLTA